MRHGYYGTTCGRHLKSGTLLVRQTTITGASCSLGALPDFPPKYVSVEHYHVHVPQYNIYTPRSSGSLPVKYTEQIGDRHSPTHNNNKNNNNNASETRHSCTCRNYGEKGNCESDSIRCSVCTDHKTVVVLVSRRRRHHRTHTIVSSLLCAAV